MTQVWFETTDFGSESESLAAAADGAVPEEPEYLWGRIVLAEPGQPDLAFPDDLALLGLALCGDARAALEASGIASLRLASWPAEYAFTTEGEQVHVTGTLDVDRRFPRDELLAGLRGCGERLAHFIGDIARQSPAFRITADALTASLEGRRS